MRLARVGIAIGAIALVVVLGLVVRASLAPTTAREQTFSGYFTPESQLRVANLTITGGQLELGYSVDVFLGAGGSGPVSCELVDTSGRIDRFADSRMTAQPGGWTTLSFSRSFDVPELTLGIRCSPERAGALTVVFRDPRLTAREG